MRGRKVYTFGDIAVVDLANDRLPILDMSQSGESRDKLISPAALVSGLSAGIDSFITTGQTGDFYPRSNPSGFISGDFSLYGSLVYINTVSGNLQSGIDNFESDITFQKVSGKAALEVFYTGSSLGYLQLSASPI